MYFKERNTKISDKLKTKLDSWKENSKKQKIDLFLSPEEVLKKAKKPLFDDEDFKPYWYAFAYHNCIQNNDVIFGIEIPGFLNDDKFLFTVNGIFYFKKKKEHRIKSNGKSGEEGTRHIPTLIDFETLSIVGNIKPSKKFFGGESASKSNIELDSDFILYGIKNEVAYYFGEIIQTIKESLIDYESSLTDSKQLLTTEISKITSASGFDDVISSNETQIQSIDPKHLHDFVKISSFLKTKEESIRRQSAYLIESAYDFSEVSDLKEMLNNQVGNYTSLYLLSINMVVALIDGHSLTYFKIYEIFDKYGVFNSQWQNEINDSLLDINTNVKKVINSIESLEMSFTLEIRSLEYSLSDKILEMHSSVEKRLGDIDAKIGYSNLLSTIRMIKK